MPCGNIIIRTAMGNRDGKDLLAISFAASAALAEGKSADEIGLLGAFLTLVGDSLALMAAKMAIGADSCACVENTSGNPQEHAPRGNILQ